jgi:WD40 repeat protein
MKIFKRYKQEKEFGLITSNHVIIDQDSFITSHCEFVLRGHKTLYKYKYGTSLHRIPLENKITKQTKFPLRNVVVGFENGAVHAFLDEEPMILQGHSQPVKYFASYENLLLSHTQNELIVWDLIEESGVVRFREKETIHGAVFLSEKYVAVAVGNILKIMDLQEKLSIETVVFKDQVSFVEFTQERLYCSMQDQANAYQIHFDVLDEKLQKDGSGLTLIGSVKRNNNHRIVRMRFFKEHLAIQTEKTVELYKLTERKGTVKEKYVGIVRLRAKIIGFDFDLKPSGIKILVSLNNNTVEHVMLEGNQQREVMCFDLHGHRSDIRALCLSSDDELLCSGSHDQLKVWSIRTGGCLLTFNSGYILCCQFVPENKHVIVGTKQGTLELYELSSGNLLETIDAHEGPIWSIEALKNGFITGAQDKQVKFWTYRLIEDPAYSAISKRVTAKHTRTLKLSDDVLCVKVSPDEKLLACALLDQTVQVFFMDSLKFFLSLYGHKLPVVSMDISSDSKIIITASSDKTVKIWGLDFGDCHKSIIAHQDSVMQVGFVWGTYNFFSCGKDKLVKFWDAEKVYYNNKV